MSTTGWMFLTNHTHVLVCISRDPSATMRAIADQVGVTERAVQRIVAELVEGGYLTRTRDGRRNEYHLNASQPLRHPLEQATQLHELLALLGAGDRSDAHPPGHHEAPNRPGSPVP